MVHVDVHVGDSLRAGRQEPGDRDGRVVVHAEPARVPAHRVMQPARDARAVLGPAGPDGARRGQGRAGHQRRGVVHAGKHRVILGAEAERQQRRAGPRLAGRHRRARARLAGQPHGRDVARVVHQLELGVGGRRRALDRHPGLAEHAERPGQLDRQLDPDRRQRMAGAEVITGQALIPGHLQRARHLLILSAGGSPRDLHRGASPSSPAVTSRPGCGPRLARPCGCAPSSHSGSRTGTSQGRHRTQAAAVSAAWVR